MPKNRGFNWSNRYSGSPNNWRLGKLNSPPPKTGLEETVRYFPFDMTFAEPAFPKVNPVLSELPDRVNASDDHLEELIKSRVKALTPTEQESSHLNMLVAKIEKVLTELKEYAGEETDVVKVASYQLVGNYKRGTVLAGNNVAEIVTFLRILPTASNVDKFSSCMINYLVSKQDETEQIEETKMDANLFEVKPDDEGFFIIHPTASVKIITTTSTNVMYEQRSDMSNLKVKEPILRLAWYLGSQSEWLEKNASEDILKNLSRLFQDISKRFTGFKPLKTWIINVFTFYIVKHSPTGKDLTMVQAFRRFFQLLSAGCFLPESSAVLDPCHPTKKPIHFRMTFEEQDMLTTTAQNLLRVMYHGGASFIIGPDGNDSLITERSTWDYGNLGSVVVTPVEVEYKKMAE